MLTLRGLTKSYGGSRSHEVLREIALTLSRGELIAVMGESGSGKSTLLNLIAGLDLPDAGSIVFEGNELTALDERARTLLRRDRMGFVFQAFHLLPHLTVLQNVRLPLDLAGKERVAAQARTLAVLDAVGIGPLAHDYPRTLSGGEIQRAAIARALVHQPALVLADEPTGNLDSAAAAQVLSLLREQISQHAGGGILVTHSDAAARIADRTYVLTQDGLAMRRG